MNEERVIKNVIINSTPLADIEDTQSFKKIMNYLERLEQDKEFISKVLKLRAIFKIPKGGKRKIKRESARFKVHGSESEIELIHLNDISLEKLRKSTNKELCEFLINDNWTDMFVLFIVFNKWIYLESARPPVDILNWNSILHDMPEEAFDFKMIQAEYLKELSETHPVVIMVSREATQNDIIDFVKKTYKSQIQPMAHYSLKGEPSFKTGRKVDKRIVRRNNFIYKNRMKSAKEIAHLVAEEFGDILEYTYINKIKKDKKYLENK
jgi:hypothetical protein